MKLMMLNPMTKRFWKHFWIGFKKVWSLDGADMPHETLCRACWRIWINGKMYLVWDWEKTEQRINAISEQTELNGGGE